MAITASLNVKNHPPPSQRFLSKNFIETDINKLFPANMLECESAFKNRTLSFLSIHDLLTLYKE